jgi:hypothetical protein
MIGIYGDSWGWSYETVYETASGKWLPKTPETNIETQQMRQRFWGRSLSDLLTERINVEVTNFCERASSNFLTIKKIHATSQLFSPGDVIFVLQTDPLRSIFKQKLWAYRNTFEATPYPFALEFPSNLKNVCDNYLLKDFYSQLSDIQNKYQIKIILHGGCSKLNRELAMSFGLTCTEKTSTEAIVPNFQDDYFYDATGTTVVENLEKLSGINNYQSDTTVELAAITFLDKKYAVWQEFPEYFSHSHTTEAGTRLVLNHIIKYMDIRGYKDSKTVK